MSNKSQHSQWSAEDAPAPASPAGIPVQTTFRHMETSAAVAARVDAEVQKLHRYYDRIARCHVVIIAPHPNHEHGPRYSIHVELSVPHGPIIVHHEPTRLYAVSAHEDIYIAIRETFDSTRRRLEDYARRMRGDVKSHGAPSLDQPTSEP